MKTNRRSPASPTALDMANVSAKQVAAYAQYVKAAMGPTDRDWLGRPYGKTFGTVKPAAVPDDQEPEPTDHWADFEETLIPEAAPQPVEPRTKPTISFTKRPIRHVPRILIADFAVKPLFYMGVEFEGMISDEAYRSFKASMISLGGNDDDGVPIIQFGVDASVKNVPADYHPVEIRTSVVRSRAGVKLFEEMLCFLYLASQTGDWLTNETCGLHINISEQRVFDDGKQADYYCHVLSNFDEDAVLATFGRDGNKYCLPFFKDGAARSYADAKRLYANLKRRERAAADRGADKWHVNEGKYLAVSLRHSPTHESYGGDEVENQRIEFRCLGNTDYHLRFDELDEAVNHIISVIRLAYREVTK